MLNQGSHKSPALSTDASDLFWSEQMLAWEYAWGKPNIRLEFKQSPRDFQVEEKMPIELTGDGEHYWMFIQKTRRHTVDVAKHIARFANVAYRDVGYSGMKDYFAQTQQWFSVYKPKGNRPDWIDLNAPGLEVLEFGQHNKKLRRSTHSANRFKVTLRGDVFQGKQDALTELENRLQIVKRNGVPNYFGPQRFGRNLSNIINAQKFLCQNAKLPRKLNDKQALWVSASRAWLFNQVLSHRIKDNSWNKLDVGEPCNLNGTHSYFISDTDILADERLQAGDIHPTAPMWGKRSRRDDDSLSTAKTFLDKERALLCDLENMMQGLENVNLSYKRRSTRCIPQSLRWYFDENSLVLEFELLPGQYATSVIREIFLHQ